MEGGSDGKPNTDLIPERLVIARYFAGEQAKLDALEVERDAVALELEDFIEEHGGEEGPLEEAKNENGKVTVKGVKDRLREIRGDKDADEERDILEKLQALFDTEAAAGKRLKDAKRALAPMVVATYGELGVAETKVLVIDGKWLEVIDSRIRSETDRVSQVLSGRVLELAVRYAMPLWNLTRAVDDLKTRVETHLAHMVRA